MSRTLLATHGGTGADGAAHLAAQLSRRLGAELSAVTVIEPLPVYDGGFAPPVVRTAEEDERDAHALLGEARAQLKACGEGACEPALRHGRAAVAVAGAARDQGASVVVLGQGPHGVLDRALGGETALELVQIATTPVLAVPASVRRLPRRVVAAVDFTPTSVLAARTAASWLREGDVLHLVHVRAPAETGAGVEGTGQRLRQLAAGLPVAAGVQVEPVELEGDPARQLLEYLARAGGEMLALGSHGYGLWKRLTLGSVASKVLRVCTTPVLVAPVGSLGAVA